jgi:hypothetical protein
MSTTKEIKQLLEQVRRRLDEESRAAVEPLLRGILEAAKPEVRTQVEYRADPKDKARIEALQAEIAEKERELEKLRSKQAVARREEAGWQKTKSVDELFQAVDKRAKAFMSCSIKCMHVMRENDDQRRKKLLLLRSVVLTNVVLATYLRTLGPCGAVRFDELKAMIDQSSSEWLDGLTEAIEARFGLEVDLQLPLGQPRSATKPQPVQRRGSVPARIAPRPLSRSEAIEGGA